MRTRWGNPHRAGDAKLVNPTDVAYSVENGELRLYAVDDHNRVVRLR
jgi:tripartite-type tricarboxylate transporter receptor subunit TctC